MGTVRAAIGQVQRSSIAVGSGRPGAVLTLGARSRHLSPGAGSIPSNRVSTGSRDVHGRVIYVGKAKSLQPG